MATKEFPLKVNKYEKLKEILRLSHDKRFSIGEFNIVDIFVCQLYLASISQSRQSRSLWESIMLLLYKAKRTVENLVLLTSLIPAKVVFLPTMKNHFDQMAPVAEALRQRNIPVQFVTNKKEVYALTRKAGFPVFVFGCYLGFASNRAVRQMPLEELPHYCPSSEFIMWAHEIGYLKNVFQRVLKACNPDLVVSGYDVTYEGRMACRFFDREKIMTACIQHGEMSGVLSLVHIAREFYVFGQSVKQQLERSYPGDKTKFILTGAPYLDSVVVMAGPSPKEKRIPKLLKGSTRNPYILVAFSGPGNNTSYSHHLKLIEAMFELDHRMDAVTVVVKLHPKDKLEYYEAYYVKYPNHRLTIVRHVNGLPELSIFDWLSGCDLLITGASSTATEAMIMDVPVISIDFEGEYSEVDFIKYGSTVHVTALMSLLKEVNAILTDKMYVNEILRRQRVYIDQYFNLPDGNAANRCADEIAKHLK